MYENNIIVRTKLHDFLRNCIILSMVQRNLISYFSVTKWINILAINVPLDSFFSATKIGFERSFDVVPIQTMLTIHFLI